MVDDFPLLFSIPKRVYKNLKELADLGFIELSSFGKTKYLRFTEKCKMWNRNETDCNQSENGPQFPKVEQQSENGPNSGPKTDQKQSENGPQYYIINNNNINNTSKKDAKASKENPAGFSQEAFSGPDNSGERKTKASVIFGFTPEALDVRKQVLDKADKYFEKLVFPFDSEDFKREFYILLCQPKWRSSQKSFSAIQSNLNGLSKYPEEFARVLIKESISKGWAALEYDSTPEKFEKWEKMKRSVKTETQRQKEYEEMMSFLNNDFD